MTTTSIWPLGQPAVGTDQHRRRAHQAGPTRATRRCTQPTPSGPDDSAVIAAPWPP